MLTIKRFIVLIALILGTWLVLPVSAQNFVWGSINGIPFGPGVDLRGNLTFTPDATHDIGASGARRPRHYFGSGNGTFGGTVTASANVAATGYVQAGYYFQYTSKPTVTVDGATTFAIPNSGYFVLECTGAETINTITGGSQGIFLIIENSDTDCTLADDDAATASNAIDLTGAGANDVGAVAKVITLIHNGTHWLQIAESDN